MKLKKSEIELLTLITEGYYKKEYIEGIYYSEVTGRIFEATLNGNEVITKYADNLTPRKKNFLCTIF
jgi:hypothetical protein